VASGLERRALTGFVLQDGLRSVGYCYYMLDAGRAIVGSLFAAAGFRGQGLEESLLDAVLAEAQSHPGNDRVECQTLFSTAAEADGRFARAGFLSRLRHYSCGRWKGGDRARASLEAARAAPEDLAPAALVIHASHRGSLDAALNLTYATPGYCAGSWRRSSCARDATVRSGASFLAEGPTDAGVVLSSHLSRTNGHICRCPSPGRAGQWPGRDADDLGPRRLRQEGLATASLSVTFDNRRAYRLYQRLGFRLRKESPRTHGCASARIELPA